MTVVLQSARLRATIDPARGFEIASILDTSSGEELVYRPHWQRAPTPAEPPDEHAWTAAWGGGWHLLVPNASVPCTVRGRRHGFHGAGSIAEWELRHEDDDRALGVWADESGLACQRGVELAGTSVTVRTFVENVHSAPLPLLLVEHLVLGGPLAGEDVRIDVPGGLVETAAWDGAPLAAAAPWPGPAGEDFSTLAGRPFSRFGIVQGVPTGRAHARNPAAGIGARLSWPADVLPNLWLWQEGCGTTEPPWDGRTACLAIEPASVARADGLAGAIARGDAIVLAPGASVETWVTLELTDGRP